VEAVVVEAGAGCEESLEVVVKDIYCCHPFADLQTRFGDSTEPRLGVEYYDGVEDPTLVGLVAAAVVEEVAVADQYL
jgi:hypothetical protein